MNYPISGIIYGLNVGMAALLLGSWLAVQPQSHVPFLDRVSGTGGRILRA